MTPSACIYTGWLHHHMGGQKGPVRKGKWRRGLHIYHQKCCNNINLHNRVCSPNIEMLTPSLRPFYLPREFSTIVIGCVYIHPKANMRVAAEQDAANFLMAKYPEAPVFIMGDCNNCTLEGVLPSSQQYVDVPTRKEQRLST